MKVLSDDSLKIGKIDICIGAIFLGQIIPLSSWFCSIAAATILETPIP